MPSTVAHKEKAVFIEMSCRCKIIVWYSGLCTRREQDWFTKYVVAQIRNSSSQRLDLFSGLRPCSVQERFDWAKHFFGSFNPGSVSHVVDRQKPGVRQYQRPLPPPAVRRAAVFRAVHVEDGG